MTSPPNQELRASPIEVRALRNHAEFRLCAELQRETWGRAFAEVVPPSLLMLGHKLGGVTAGAFDEDGRLLGFVFGISGIRKGHRAHWSHMLAVRPQHRNRGLGRRLKLFQRETLLAQDIGTMYWTFDPLEAKNAYLNIERLGVQIDEYLEEVYPASTSPVHRLGTDRLVARWELASRQPDTTSDSVQGDDPEPVINPLDAEGRPAAQPSIDHVGRALRIEVPCSVEGIKEDDLELGLQWRASTRAAFRWALSHGYHVTSFRRDDGCSYRLARD